MNNLNSQKNKMLPEKMLPENQIQQQIFIWFNNTYCLKFQEPRGIIFSVPNDSINAIETKRKKQTGLLRGASDMIIILPNGKLIFVEIKTEKGVQSEYQKYFQNRVEKLGYKYLLIRSLKQFQDEITTHIITPNNI